ncbi:MAG: tRNA (guanosine(46)-N7)-methyltransferase TrmB [Bacteroidia bacterium]|nr:tRNA (guanosine(46)-N7)-methyltransferase TrmB [Bacteroidia bacterium]
MPRKKLIRINAFDTLPNALTKPYHLKGQWQQFFGNENPIIAELGCGKAEFSVSIAQQNPNYNVIAIDLKPDRLYVGALNAIKLNLNNIVFVKLHIEEVTQLFSNQELSSIWLTFPDPHPKQNSAHKRLTHHSKLTHYAQALADNAPLNLKTDNLPLFQYSIDELLGNGWNIIYQETDCDILLDKLPELSIHTTFEKTYRGRTQKICFLRAIFSPK